MSLLNNIRYNLSEKIKNSDFTQTEIAHILNINPATVSHYVKGNKLPSLDTLSKLCAALDLDANDILCINDNKSFDCTTFPQREFKKCLLSVLNIFVQNLNILIIFN